MDLGHLLQPIKSERGHCGEDLIFSTEFDDIQQARRYDDPSLSQGEWITSVKDADWNTVIRICDSLLTSRTKDLRLAAWMTEAMGKTHGLGGLANGYTLLAELCERFWQDIHPQSDDDDQEARIGVLDWLVNQSARLIRETALTKSIKGNFSCIDQESARTTARNLELNPQLADEVIRSGCVTQELFEAALKDTPTRHFVEGINAAEQLKAAVSRLQLVLERQLGENSPTFGHTFDTLDDLSRFFRRHAGDQWGNPQPDNKADAGHTSAQTDRLEPSIGDPGPESAGGPVRSREHAIRQLNEIAAFFKRTEPHSPVAYLAEKAARWGGMPLHVWLRSVIKDDSALSSMEELLGVEREFQDQAGAGS